MSDDPMSEAERAWFLPAPGPATRLEATSETSNSIALEWHAPAWAFKPSYAVRYREKGQASWIVYPTKTTDTKLTVKGLRPKTTYEFEVLTTNGH
jgi:hypothetical protein